MTPVYVCAAACGFSAVWLLHEAVASLTAARHHTVRHVGSMWLAMAACVLSALALVDVLPAAVP